MTLRLGPTEQYNSSGPSIKKAQHSAAEVALLDTEYKHPPPKPARVARQSEAIYLAKDIYNFLMNSFVFVIL